MNTSTLKLLQASEQHFCGTCFVNKEWQHTAAVIQVNLDEKKDFWNKRPDHKQQV